MTDRTRPRRTDPARWFGPLGILAILIAATIGWIAFRANFGLPWQSHYDVSVEVPNADRLIPGADVRIGGVLVGEVLRISAEAGTAGAPPYARLKLSLDSSAGPLPVDTSALVRPASVLGLTYVELDPGHSAAKLPAGATLPLARSRPSYDLDDLLGLFNRSSARSFQRSLTGLAYGMAGRGPALNTTIATTARLLPELTAVSRELAAPSTELGSTLAAYERLVGALAPVAGTLGSLTDQLATTFTAIAGVRGPLAMAIQAAPPAEAETTSAFIAAQPAFTTLAQLASALRPAGAVLGGALSAVDRTLAAGVRPMRQLPAFAHELGVALRALAGLAHDPSTSGSLRKLYDLVVPTNEVLSELVPAQVYCNLLGTWSQNFGSMWGGLGDGEGPALANLVLTGVGAAGEELQSARPASNVAMNPLPNENASECESGNEPWSGHQQLNNPPGLQGRDTRTTAPPPGATALARKAGLLAPIPGIR